MNNLDKITDKILAEANETAAAAQAEAVESSARIVGDAEERAAAIISAGKVRAAKDAEAIIARAQSTADMKRREILLGARVGLISKAFAEAEKYIYELSTEDYCVFLAHLLADAAEERINTVEGLRKMYGDSEDYCLDFEVVFNEKDKAEIGELVIKAAKQFLKRKSAALGKTAFSVSDDCADIKGGLVLRYGDIESNCSVEAVIADAKAHSEGEVAKILFADAAPVGKADEADAAE